MDYNQLSSFQIPGTGTDPLTNDVTNDYNFDFLQGFQSNMEGGRGGSGGGDAFSFFDSPAKATNDAGMMRRRKRGSGCTSTLSLYPLAFDFLSSSSGGGGGGGSVASNTNTAWW